MQVNYLKLGEFGKFTNISFENTKISIGSLFTEKEIFNIKNIIDDQSKSFSDLQDKNKTNLIKNNYPQILQNTQSDKIKSFFFEISDINLKDIFENINTIIITNIDEIYSLPFIFRKLLDIKANISFININSLSNKIELDINNQHDKKHYINNIFNKIKIITTIPIIQISKTLLNDFYKYFNKILIESLPDCKYYVNSLLIESLIDSITEMNYNSPYIIEDNLSISLMSSGYNLGSSNIFFRYFNKNIIYLSNSSFFSFRYTKAFEESLEFNCYKGNKYENPNKRIDVLICKDDIINFKDNFIKEFEDIINKINEIMRLYNRENGHYPNIFWPVDPLFILDFINIIRFKISNEIKFFYLSPIVKSILEYSNVSHGFINKTYHDKIYEFKLPFSYDELIKNSKSII
jgi:hypothetical protein